MTPLCFFFLITFFDNAFIPLPQAREFLYFKLTGRQLTTPVAIMTSDAKGNNHRMTQLMESLRWFGRGRDAFKLFRWVCVGGGGLSSERDGGRCVWNGCRGCPFPLVLPWAR